MKVETIAAIYKADSFHSNKTGKDYRTIGLILEGQAGTFFVSEQTYTKVINSPMYRSLCDSALPQKCIATLDIRIGEKGAQVNIDAVVPAPADKPAGK